MSQNSNAYQSEQSKLAERLRPLADEVLRTLKEEYVTWLQEVEKIEVGEIEVEKGEKVPLYKLWRLMDPATPTVGQSLESVMPANASSEVINAYLFMDMCDFVTYALREAVGHILQNYKANVKWVLYKPRPRFMLTEMGQEDPPRHSVLTVTDKNGKTYIMDLTHPQFGFRLLLLLDKDIYVKEYTNINEIPEVADSKLQTEMKELSEQHYDGLYQKLQERLTKMAKASVRIESAK
ncbi:hypothetical protein BU24DRAFT_458922 [Aaosphaeria arxii CBS 175.79]|uniref:Uncharacterized protein n=1 Tax=Aaosphaeria arxii CBS 175.79 TaxID=1450172 RepID=A0A6A5Y170_9PLEO|nr:uncharacterized protein BU24DRAFT_458922 [Aaosphaeria arxii CBS 175.79]KAF2019222.1 hypothetical protein BU24DRAFT_458922 [Aaosphaeria arxii CBS 175.79]